jgi:hypothetical protein
VPAVEWHSFPGAEAERAQAADAALAAIPKLLPDNMDERRKAFSAIQDVLSASAQISGEVAKRLNQVAGLFGLDDQDNMVAFDPKTRASRSHRKDPE